MKQYPIALSLVGLAMLAGCAHPNEPLHHSFGQATAANMNAQIIDPTPAGTGPTETDGSKVADAIENYTSGTVIEAKAEETTSEE